MRSFSIGFNQLVSSFSTNSTPDWEILKPKFNGFNQRASSNTLFVYPQVSAMMREKDSQKRSLLAFAAESMDADTFKAVQRSLERELSEEEVGWRFKFYGIFALKVVNICLFNRRHTPTRQHLVGKYYFPAVDSSKSASLWPYMTLSKFVVIRLRVIYDLIGPNEYLGNKLLLQVVQSDKGKNIGLLKAVLKAVRRCLYFNNVRYAGIEGQCLMLAILMFGQKAKNLLL